MGTKNREGSGSPLPSFLIRAPWVTVETWYRSPPAWSRVVAFFTRFAYAKAAVMMAMEYTSRALQPRLRSLMGAFSPNRMGP